MSQKRSKSVLAYSIAAESQLLAEERWIIDALNKIKTQRNCLQIERLHLESMKNLLAMNSINALDEEKTLMDSKEPSEDQSKMEIKPAIPSTTDDHFLTMTEAVCNNEELNLNVSNSIFNKMTVDLSMEEEEEPEEVDNCEDLLIDMNMFMNGIQTSSQKDC